MKNAVLALAGLLLITGVIRADVFRVPEEIQDIQSAIDFCIDGDTILVADGQYKGKVTFLGKAIVVCGNIENPERVILTAPIGSSVVAFRFNEGADAVLCGFTIRGGRTDYGGGIYVKDASPTLHHLIVDSNYASDTGGGIYIGGDCRPLISDVVLRVNQAKSGGGIGIFSNADAVLENITISKCTATNYGGGIYIKDASPTLRELMIDSNVVTQAGGGIYFSGNCRTFAEQITLKGNSAGSGGGIGVYDSATVVLENITVSNCKASNYGGGIYVKDASPVFEHTTVDSCTAGKNGGGMHFTGNANIIVNNTVLTNNSSLGSTGGGGGMTCYNKGVVTATGMTVSGCRTAGYGGGIQVSTDSKLLLKHFLMDNNRSDINYGASLFRYSGGIIEAEDGIIRNNVGYTIYLFSGPSCTLDRILFENNDGGILYLGTNGSVFASSLTIANNKGASIFYRENGTLLLSNSIVWGNRNTILGGAVPLGTITARYSNIEELEEWEIQEGQIGDGVISADPLFTDPANGDFTLQRDSPCLHSGDPDLPKDADSTRADMGCFTLLDYGTIRGKVTTMEPEPRLIEGAVITTNYGAHVIPDEEGNYLLTNVPACLLTLTASAPGFIDSVITFNRGVGDFFLFRDFQLKAPRLVIGEGEYHAKVEQYDSTGIKVYLSNKGIGPLAWELTPTLKGNWTNKAWSHTSSVPVPDIDGLIVLGVAYLQGRFVLSCRLRMDGFFLVLDSAGAELNRFPQPGNSTSYITDLDSDGEFVYGNKDAQVYRIALDGETRELFKWEGEESSAIAWDSQRNLLWMVDKLPKSPLLGYALDGNLVQTIEKAEPLVSGLAFWQDEPEGFQLYSLSRIGVRYTIHQFNCDTRQGRWVTELIPPSGGTPKACIITDDFGPYNSVAFLTPVRESAGNQIQCWSVWTNLSWIKIDPDRMHGTIQADWVVEIPIRLSAERLLPGEYQATFQFKHTGINETQTLPFTLTVLPPTAFSEGVSPLPTEFAITSLYPNPFNARLTVGYALPQTGDVTVRVYDIGGREVYSQRNGAVNPGYHRLTVDCSHMPNGLYLVQVTTGGRSITKKALLLK